MKRLTIILTVFLQFSLCIPMFGQYACDWGQAVFPGTLSSSYNGPSCMTVDEEGNVYVAGQVGTPKGAGDIFMAKYKRSGKQVWLYVMNSWGDNRPIGIGVANGHVYLYGQFTLRLDVDLNGDFGNGPVNDLRASRAGFIAKYRDIPSSAGVLAHLEYEKATYFEGFATGINGYGGLVLDQNENVYVAGYGAGDITLMPSGTVVTPPAPGAGANEDFFLLSYDSQLTYRWGMVEGSETGNDQVRGIAIDDQNHVFITGVFRDKCDFGGSVNLEVNHSGDLPYHAFLACYDSQSGNLARVIKPEDSNFRSTGFELAVDKVTETIYMAGVTQGKLVFPNQVEVNSGKDNNVFVAGFDISDLKKAAAGWGKPYVYERSGNDVVKSLAFNEKSGAKKRLALLLAETTNNLIDDQLQIQILNPNSAILLPNESFEIDHNRFPSTIKRTLSSVLTYMPGKDKFFLSSAYFYPSTASPLEYLDLGNNCTYPNTNLPLQHSESYSETFIAKYSKPK